MVGGKTGTREKVWRSVYQISGGDAGILYDCSLNPHFDHSFLNQPWNLAWLDYSYGMIVIDRGMILSTSNRAYH